MEHVLTMANLKLQPSLFMPHPNSDSKRRYRKGGQVQIPIVMMENQTREEVMIRIKAGWSCFGRFKDILCDRKTTNVHKKENVRPVCNSNYDIWGRNMDYN